MNREEIIRRNLFKLAILPALPNSKKTILEGGYAGALTGVDVNEIVERKYNPALSLSLSHLMCLDCDYDVARGLDGVKTIENLEKKLGKLPPTLTQRTPRGGCHMIFKDKGIVNPVGKIGKDCDVKWKGYIMIEPSQINGKKYELQLDGMGEDFYFAELPQSWLDYINKSNKKETKTNEKFDYSKKQVIRPVNADIDKIIENCNFLKYCRDNAYDLEEPMWFSMVSVLANIVGSDAIIHALSSPYKKYCYNETEKKIAAARKFGCPQSCAYISANYPVACENCKNANKGGI